jgi:hypothetical protein
MLRADLSRFYNTIYTHSLPWAIHGKEKAKSDHGPGLFGNALDSCVRNTQDQQTLGLPVGPDTSFILSEIIAAAIDFKLQAELPKLAGSRYVDDFHLYFQTRAEAERAYSILTRVVRYFELEVNDPKTMILEGPDTGEPRWKTAIKAQNIRAKGNGQRSSLISFVSKAFELAKDFPGQGVLAYALKKAVATNVEEDNLDVFESFIRAALIHDTSTIEIVTRVLYDQKKKGQLSQLEALKDCISELCFLSVKAGFAYEVSWLLWLYHVLEVDVPDTVSGEVSNMDDPLVALSALALNDAGMIAHIGTKLWESAMNADNLYSGYWILVYEAAHRGWLATNGDYVLNDPFFSQLDKADVSLCNVPLDSGVKYVDLPMPGAGYFD